jgi:hypothetical protein
MSLELIWAEKNLKALEFINDNNIMLNYSNRFGRKLVTMTKNNIEFGKFYIDYNSGLLDMSIYIEDDPSQTLNICLRGKGLARLMIGFLIINNIEPIRKDQLIFIDSDASAGFWDIIGMIPNRYYERNDRQVIGSGYEKVITFSKFSKWALGVSLGI